MGHTQYWTAARDAELTRRYELEGQSWDEIAAAMGRNVGAVKARKKLLGLRRQAPAATSGERSYYNIPPWQPVELWIRRSRRGDRWHVADHTRAVLYCTADRAQAELWKRQYQEGDYPARADLRMAAPCYCAFTLAIRTGLLHAERRPDTDAGRLCRGCWQYKPLQEYPRHRGRSGGHHRTCKACRRARAADSHS